MMVTKTIIKRRYDYNFTDDAEFKLANQGSVWVRLSFSYLLNGHQLSAHCETMMILMMMQALKTVMTMVLMVVMMKTFVSAICFIGSSLVRRGK